MQRPSVKLILLFVLLAANIFAQVFSDSTLCKPDVISLSGRYYAFGYVESAKGLGLEVRQLSGKEEITKSFSYDLGKHTCSEYYGLQADTVHGYLNLIVQEINNDRTCRIIRLDKKLKLIADIRDAEVSHVNTFTAYDDEFLYYKNELYVVRPFSRDSSDRFFLQKYKLKDSSKVFEYENGWQLNFGKQKYHRVHIITANKKQVFLFVDVMEGSRKGQWILLVDAIKGEILHSESLNEGNAGFTFLYGDYYYNKQTHELSISGYRLPEKKVSADYNHLDLSVTGLKAFPVFLCTLDSVGKATERFHNFVNIPNDLEKEKEFKQYLCKIRKFQYVNGQYAFLYELLAGNPNNKAFKTYGLQYALIEHNEENALQAKTNVFVSTYADPKNKEAKKIFNLYEMGNKQNADEILYKPAVSGSIKGFEWNLQFGSEKIVGYADFDNKKENIFYKYSFANNTWQIAELPKVPSAAVFRTFLVGMETILIFKNTTYDPETNTGKGLEGSGKQLLN